jgi:hypothetical protein
MFFGGRGSHLADSVGSFHSVQCVLPVVLANTYLDSTLLLACTLLRLDRAIRPLSPSSVVADSVERQSTIWPWSPSHDYL